MTKVVVYTDFDGTVTRRVGKDAVFSPFYQSLLNTVGVIRPDYKTTPMRAPGEIQSLFEQKFGVYDEDFNHSQVDADLLISPEAATFFHEMLKNNDVVIRIVTKNRSEYVNALFKYQGFSDEEIKKLEIKDSGYKFQDVDKDLKSFAKPSHITQKPSHILYILDDYELDFTEMVNAAKINMYQEEQIHAYRNEPGTFDWNTYREDIQKLTAAKHSIQESLLSSQDENHDSSATKPVEVVDIQSTVVNPVTDHDAPVAALKIKSSPTTGSDEVVVTKSRFTDDIHTNKHHVASLKSRKQLNREPLIESTDELVQESESNNLDDFAKQTKLITPETPVTDNTSEIKPNRRAIITGTAAAIGISLGVLIGGTLLATGVLAPLGLTVLGTIGLLAAFGVSTGLLTGLIGYISAIGSEPQPESKNQKDNDNNSSIMNMSGLGTNVEQQPKAVPVEHFSNLFVIDKSSHKNTKADNDRLTDTDDKTFTP